MNNTYLAHHGVLGMKWGVRRYQKKDGSLTEAGKRRKDKIVDKLATKTAKKASKIYAKGMKYPKKYTIHYPTYSDPTIRLLSTKTLNKKGYDAAVKESENPNGKIKKLVTKQNLKTHDALAKEFIKVNKKLSMNELTKNSAYEDAAKIFMESTGFSKKRYSEFMNNRSLV